MKNVATDVYAVTYAESNSLHGGAMKARAGGSRRPQAYAHGTVASPGIVLKQCVR